MPKAIPKIVAWLPLKEGSLAKSVSVISTLSPLGLAICAFNVDVEVNKIPETATEISMPVLKLMSDNNFINRGLISHFTDKLDAHQLNFFHSIYI